MSGQPLTPVDEVIATLLDKVVPTTELESVAVAEASGRYLGEDVISAVDVPPQANSAMDGYAVAAADIAAGQSYSVSQRIAAGQSGSPLVPGTLARIFTGAPIPAGADAVVIQEDTEIEGELVTVTQAPMVADNVRPMGQDIQSGTVVLRQGQRLLGQDLSLAASVGLSHVRVYRQLRAAILSTGDELVEPPAALGPGQIYNSNRHALRGLLLNLGYSVLDLGIVSDTPEATRSALERASADADIIFTTGGVSVGEEDHVRDAVLKLGALDLWRIAIKPGKPLAFGHVAGIPIFGLPGNPVSTFVTFVVIATPYLRALHGEREVGHQFLPGIARFEFRAGGRREYLRVRTAVSEAGMELEMYPEQGSGVMSSVVWANALAEVEADQSIQPGDKVRYLMIR